MGWSASKRVAQKRIAITIFSFPPDKGKIGTAAHLGVFGSTFKGMEGVREKRYNVGDMPRTAEQLLENVLHDKRSTYQFS